MQFINPYFNYTYGGARCVLCQQMPRSAYQIGTSLAQCFLLIFTRGGVFIWMLIRKRCKKWCGFIDYRKSEAILQTDGQQTKFIFWGGLSDSASMMRWLHASLEGWVSKMSMLCTPELDNRIANSSHFILYFQKRAPLFNLIRGTRYPRRASQGGTRVVLDYYSWPNENALIKTTIYLSTHFSISTLSNN